VQRQASVDSGIARAGSAATPWNRPNSLPFSVVTAPSVNSFKNRLDKHSASQELRYDWEAELSGTGSRSSIQAELNFDLFEFYHYIF